MRSLVFGPRHERQELCAALDIPLAAALSEECDRLVVGIVEVAWMSFGPNSSSFKSESAT